MNLSLHVFRFGYSLKGRCKGTKPLNAAKDKQNKQRSLHLKAPAQYHDNNVRAS